MGRSIARAASHGALLLVGLATLARADVVELMNGQRLDGRVDHVTSSVVVLHRYGGVITLARDSVRAIYLEPGTAGAPLARPVIRDAVDPVRRLADANASSVTHAERQQRLAEAKATVERYARSPDGPTGVQEP